MYQFYSRTAGCHVYLIVGDELNVLVDTGIITKFNSFNYLLTTEVGLKIEDIDLVINTHEHFDHISSNAYFHCPIAAHRWAAVKIQHSDELITKGKKWGVNLTEMRINIWLEDRNIIDLGNTMLKVIETPGHTSGCICVYELNERLLFSGDTVFAGGTLSDIATSGNISDYVNSVERLSTLRIAELCPGHGRVSDTPEQDMRQAVVYARTLMEDSKVLFEAITPKKKDTPSSRVLSGRDETDGEKEAGK